MEEFSSELILQRSSSLLVPKRIGFGYLPVDILVKIFQYFDEDELRNNIIKVCQQWRLAAEDPSLWKTLKFQGRTIDTHLICNKIWQFRNVNNIIIKTILDPVVVLRQICRRCEDLTTLVLRNCPEISEDALRYLLVSCKRLRVLDLKGTPFQALILFEELPHCQALRSINLGGNPHLNLKNVQTLAMNCHYLTGFHLGCFQPKDKLHLNDGSCYFVLTKLVHNLTHLSLDCSTLSACTFASILRCNTWSTFA
nr:unnamed protein product [Callosobruchus analis]